MSSSPIPSQEKKPIERLPPYFPTTCKQCAKPTEEFFTCFETHAIMRDEKDKTSAKQALLYCQPELRQYMQCMEKYIAEKDKKPWYKIF